MHHSEIDLLTLPLSATKGAWRDLREFNVETPWALVRFGKLHLKPGWWRLNSKGSPPHAEVRLSSDRNPLIVIPVKGDAARIYIGDDAGYHVTLMVSPWPGKYAFSELRLSRLNAAGLAGMALGAAGRLARHKQPLTVLRRAGRRLIAGQALGLRVSPSHLATDARPIDQKVAGEAGAEVRHQISDAITLRARAGDRVHKSAAALARHAFEQRPQLKAIYSDVIEAGQLVPHPEWDRDLALAGAFDNAPLFSRTDTHTSNLAEAVKVWGEESVARLPLPLVERGGVATANAQVALELTEQSRPLVSVVIPTKFRMDLLEKCIHGLIHKTGYPDLEIIVVDNGVTDVRFPSLLDPARARFDVQVVEDKGPFNFSRLANTGAARARGEIVLLLNDDIEPLESGWLHRIVESAMRPDIGAVGAQLLYPDGSIQHAGVVLGLGGTCAHLWRGISADAAKRNVYIQSAGRRMAVTGACLAVKRSAFQMVGGFDEEAFPVAYNDIDFCLRLSAKGLQNMYRGDAVLVHHESKSRGSDEATAAAHKRQSLEAERFLQRWRGVLETDPFFSPALDQLIESGAAHVANFARLSDYVDLRELAETAAQGASEG